MDVKHLAQTLFCPGRRRKVKFRGRDCGIREELWMRSKVPSFSHGWFPLGESSLWNWQHWGGRRVACVEWAKPRSGAQLSRFRSWPRALGSLHCTVWIPISINRSCENVHMSLRTTTVRVWALLWFLRWCSLSSLWLCWFFISASLALKISGKGWFLFYSSTLR